MLQTYNMLVFALCCCILYALAYKHIILVSLMPVMAYNLPDSLYVYVLYGDNL